MDSDRLMAAKLMVMVKLQVVGGGGGGGKGGVFFMRRSKFIIYTSSVAKILVSVKNKNPSRCSKSSAAKKSFGGFFAFFRRKKRKKNNNSGEEYYNDKVSDATTSHADSARIFESILPKLKSFIADQKSFSGFRFAWHESKGYIASDNNNIIFSAPSEWSDQQFNDFKAPYMGKDARVGENRSYRWMKDFTSPIKALMRSRSQRLESPFHPSQHQLASSPLMDLYQGGYIIWIFKLKVP